MDRIMRRISRWWSGELSSRTSLDTPDRASQWIPKTRHLLPLFPHCVFIVLGGVLCSVWKTRIQALLCGLGFYGACVVSDQPTTGRDAL